MYGIFDAPSQHLGSWDPHYFHVRGKLNPMGRARHGNVERSTYAVQRCIHYSTVDGDKRASNAEKSCRGDLPAMNGGRRLANPGAVAGKIRKEELRRMVSMIGCTILKAGGPESVVSGITLRRMAVAITGR